MSDIKLLNSITFSFICIGLFFYTPFIIFGLKYGISKELVPLFISLITLYTQLLLPPFIKLFLKILDAKIQYTPYKNKTETNKKED